MLRYQPAPRALSRVVANIHDPRRSVITPVRRGRAGPDLYVRGGMPFPNCGGFPHLRITAIAMPAADRIPAFASRGEA